MLERFWELVLAPFEFLFWPAIIVWILVSSFMTFFAYSNFQEFDQHQSALLVLCGLTGFPLFLALGLTFLGPYYIITGRTELRSSSQAITGRLFVIGIGVNLMATVLFFLR